MEDGATPFACQGIVDRKREDSSATPKATVANGVAGLFMQVRCAAWLPHLLGRQGLDNLESNLCSHPLLGFDSGSADVR